MWKPVIAITAILSSVTSFAAVDINQAGVADLDGIKGIGPALSSRILDERKQGSFKDWTDLMRRVKGIGNTSAQRLSREGLTVNGATYGTTQGAPGLPGAKAKPDATLK